jgi:hypothetical protein
MQLTTTIRGLSLLAISAIGLIASAGVYASGTDRDPLDGTVLANNPQASYGILFGSICTYSLPGGHGPFPPADSQADEGLNISFGVVFECNPDDPDAGFPQEDVDFDPLPNE